MDPRYPIGRFQPPEASTPFQRAEWIDELRAAPQVLRDSVHGLTDAHLDTPYREQGWSPRQIVHHVADSHLNSYVRFKWTLTEDTPTIKAYDQDAWARTPENAGPIEPSVAVFDALHTRWVDLLERLGDKDWQRSFVHPESGREVPLFLNLALYAWHGRHHAAQIRGLRERKGW